jgi:hypothetical protein
MVGGALASALDPAQTATGRLQMRLVRVMA